MTRTDRECLQQRLKQTPYLIIDVETNVARLASADEMLANLGNHTSFVMDLQGALRGFNKLTDQSVFSLTDLATVADAEYHGVHAWMRNGVITPSIRDTAGAGRGRGPQFSFADAFAAGVIGTLRRNGISLESMRQIAPLLNRVTKQTSRN